MHSRHTHGREPTVDDVLELPRLDSAEGERGDPILPQGDLDPRLLTRTPSPTPSENAYLSRKSVINWSRLRTRAFWLRRELAWHYLAAVIVIVLVTLFSHYERSIVHALRPIATWMRDKKYGWLIPIGVLFVISFPPLLGHEIVAILCGLVWGLGIGFGIVAAGTLIGELGNFYAFRYCCRSRAAKMEKNTILYACFTKIVREGGFKIALITRYSILPGHLTTAVYSTCGLGAGLFTAAAFLSLPKQFMLIYIGVLVEDSDKGHGVSTKASLISFFIVLATTLVTVVAGWYIVRQMNRVKDGVIHERRTMRQTKTGTPFDPEGGFLSRSDDPGKQGSISVPLKDIHTCKDTEILGLPPLHIRDDF